MKTTRKILVALLIVMTMLVGVFSISASAADDGSFTIYLNPGPWNVDGAKFQAYTWQSSDTSNGGFATSVIDSDGDGIYEITVPAGRDMVSFKRENPNKAGEYWNQSGDIAIPSDGKNLCTITGWGANDYNWTTYSVSCDHVFGETGKCTNEGCNAGHTYTLVGTIGPNGWNPAAENKMKYNSETGTYSQTINNVDAGDYEFKCAQDGSWDVAYPQNADNSNYKLSVEKKGSTVTISLKGGVISVDIAAPECNHNYELTGGTAASCTTAGNETYTCSACGDSYDKEVAALGHHYVNGECDREGCEATTEYITVYVADAAGWGTVYCYTWGDTPYMAWPGEAMTQGEDGRWSYQIPAGYTNVIFNNNGKTEETKAQSADLTVPTDANVIYNNSTTIWSGAQSGGETGGEQGGNQGGSSSSTPSPVDYYLVGYINGADYGFGDQDWERLGDYKFVNGKVTVDITELSYVIVKTGDNANWYMFQTYCESTSGTLYNTTTGAAEKMAVPEGKVTFTLVVNADGTLTLSYKVTSSGSSSGSTDNTQKPGTDNTQKPGSDNTQKPDTDNNTQQPEQKLNFFQKVVKAVTDFFGDVKGWFGNIADWFKNLFAGNKK